MKSIKYFKRRLKKNKTNKTKIYRNKSKKNRKSYRRRRGGMDPPAFDRTDSTNTEAYGNNINAFMKQPTENKSASFFTHQPGVGRSGLNLRNKVRNSYLGLRGVDTSDCDKESFDKLTSFPKQMSVYNKCCGAKSSSPFCKYAKNIMKNTPQKFDDAGYYEYYEDDDEDTIDRTTF